MKTLLIACALMLGAADAHAEITGPIQVRGKVGNFNSDRVVLHTESGKVIVPRRNVEIERIRPGMEIMVSVPVADLFRMNAAKEKDRR